MQHSGTDCGSRKSDDAREFVVANPHERMIKKVDVALYLCMVGISTASTVKDVGQVAVARFPLG